MRNIVSKLALAAVLAAGMATPVLADVDAVANITKDKLIEVDVKISINKDINLNVLVDVDVVHAAEAMALVNQVTRNNLVDRNVTGESLSNGTNNTEDRPVPQGINDEALVRDASILGTAGGSVNFNIGVTGVNQDVGAMTNQGNVWSVALAEDDPENPSLFADAEAEVDQLVGGLVFDAEGQVSVNSGNTLDWTDSTNNNGGPLVDNITFGVTVLATLEDSVNGNLGLTGVNQNSGNFNNQVNAVAASGGISISPGLVLADIGIDIEGTTVALAEAALGQEVAGNFAEMEAVFSDSTIDNSVNNNTGVTHVNQSSGSFANQANVVAVGAAIFVN